MKWEREAKRLGPQLPTIEYEQMRRVDKVRLSISGAFVFCVRQRVPESLMLLALVTGTVMVLSMRTSMPVCAGSSTSFPLRATI